MADWSKIGNIANIAFGLGGFGMGLFGDNNGSQQLLANSKALSSYNAKLNYEYNQRYAENAPSWNRVGLESANYNPNLPFLGSGSGMSSASSFSSAPTAGSYDYNSKATNALSLGKLLSDINVAREQARNLASQTENTKTQTLSQLIKNKFLPERERAEIAKVVSDRVLNEAEAEAAISNAKSHREIASAHTKNAETNRQNTIANVITTGLGALGLGAIAGKRWFSNTFKRKIGF